jgi:hypothetical protein
MAQYRLSVQKAVSRGKGKSGVAKAAYNARDKIRDERTGELKDYSRNKNEVTFSGIFVDPKRNAPARLLQDRSALWNTASAAENRKDAREAQEIIVNLPHELSDQQRRFMLTDFVREHITRGTWRIADVNMHAAPKHGDDRNIHAHILMTVREIGPDGFGKKLPDVTPQQIRHWKEKWAERGAKELRKAGFEIEADRWAVGYMDLPKQREEALKRGDLAYAETLNREATKHLGPHVASMERKGIETDRGNVEREKTAANLETANLKSELAEIQKQIAAAEREAPLAFTVTGSRETKHAEINALAAMLQKPEPRAPANDNELREKLAAFGFDAGKAATLEKWQELGREADAGRITQKDRFRDMAQYLWHEADKERRNAQTPKETRGEQPGERERQQKIDRDR